MTILARDDDPPTGPSDEERQAFERASRAKIRKIFAAVFEDRWSVVHDIYREAQTEGEWMAVAVWAGLPGTVKERIRSEDETNRPH